MPRRPLPAAVKKAKGTFRADRHKAPPALPALITWPPAPRHFNRDERTAWGRLGKAVMALGSVSLADVLFCERVAQVSARVDEALKDPDFKPTALNALLKLEADLRRQLGITPQARGAVQPLEKEPEEDEDDPLAEFGGG